MLSLWWATLDVPSSDLPGLESSLAPVEHARADRFHSPTDRARWIVARGWLRRLLATELGCPTEQVEIVARDGEKPTIPGSDLRFSASRSGALALYATSRDMEVGVDVEAIRDTTDVDGVATRFFSPDERRALASLPPERRLEAFFECWTRKEAFVKGTGAGLSHPLRTVDVWAGDRQPVSVSGWVVHRVEVAPGFAAAVAGARPGDWVPETPHELGASQ